MKAILYVYLAALYMQTGMAEKAADDAATAVTHVFVAGVYALPMVGAILADRLLGKYDTILWLSLLYTAGHGMLAISEGELGGTYIGLALIAIGAGGIKPCVSANVGDQFGKANWHRLERVYQAFYFIINFGSFFSTLLIPWMKERGGVSAWPSRCPAC
jgi:POT family proton-dependent oligopeptide transporter